MLNCSLEPLGIRQMVNITIIENKQTNNIYTMGEIII